MDSYTYTPADGDNQPRAAATDAYGAARADAPNDPFTQYPPDRATGDIPARCDGQELLQTLRAQLETMRGFLYLQRQDM